MFEIFVLISLVLIIGFMLKTHDKNSKQIDVNADKIYELQVKLSTLEHQLSPKHSNDNEN